MGRRRRGKGGRKGLVVAKRGREGRSEGRGRGGPTTVGTRGGFTGVVAVIAVVDVDV